MKVPASNVTLQPTPAPQVSTDEQNIFLERELNSRLLGGPLKPHSHPPPLCPLIHSGPFQALTWSSYSLLWTWSHRGWIGFSLFQSLTVVRQLCLGRSLFVH